MPSDVSIADKSACYTHDLLMNVLYNSDTTGSGKVNFRASSGKTTQKSERSEHIASKARKTQTQKSERSEHIANEVSENTDTEK